MEHKTKGQLEAQISEVIIKFEKEYMGKGPLEAKSYIIKDMIFVRLKGVLSQGEEQLAKTAEGVGLIKKMRTQLLERARPLLENAISDATSARVNSLHTDISTKTGERVIVFILDQNLENKF